MWWTSSLMATAYGIGTAEKRGKTVLRRRLLEPVDLPKPLWTGHSGTIRVARRPPAPFDRTRARRARSPWRSRRVPCPARPARPCGTGRDPRASPRPDPAGPGSHRPVSATSARTARSGAARARCGSPGRASAAVLLAACAARPIPSAPGFRGAGSPTSARPRPSPKPPPRRAARPPGRSAPRRPAPSPGAAGPPWGEALARPPAAARCS